MWNVFGGRGCLLSQTFRRISKIVPPGNILVITNGEQTRGIAKYAPEIPRRNVIAEPCGRDTSAAILLAATAIKCRNENASFAVFPSDHIVKNSGGFSKTMRAAFEIAEGGDRLVTVGISPSFPATGYGYIKRGKKAENKSGVYYKAAGFFEKPGIARAKAFVKSGSFYWNAGIFAWKTESILKAAKKYIPDSHKIFEKIRSEMKKGASLDDACSAHYGDLKKISIDFAVMEKAENVYVVPASFDWDDAGSWNALERHLKADENGIVCAGRGKTFSKNSANCTVFDAGGRSTAIVGARDLIVVHTKDATLICKKDCAESFKDLVGKLPKKLR